MNFERQLLKRVTDRAELARAYELGLRPEVFQDPLCKQVYDWTVKYWQDTQMELAPTTEVLQHQFPLLRELGESEESTSWLIEQIQENWARVEVQSALMDAAEQSTEDARLTASRTWQRLYAISESIAPRLTRMDLSQNIDERTQWYIDGASRVRSRGMTLGFPEVDQHTQGVLPGEITAVSAYTKVGKSVFLANAAVQAKKQGYKPILFTLEMSLQEMAVRLDAIWSGVSYDKLTKFTLEPDEMSRLREAREEIAELGPFLLEMPERGDRTVKYLMNRARWLGCDYVIIDQLSHMDGSKEFYRDLKSKYSELIFDIKDEATRPTGPLPVLLAVQLNRESVKEKAGAQLHTIAGAAEIEQTVDLALGLSRTREQRANKAMQLNVLGSRRCDLGAWLLRWDLVDSTSLEVREVLDA